MMMMMMSMNDDNDGDGDYIDGVQVSPLRGRTERVLPGTLKKRVRHH